MSQRMTSTTQSRLHQLPSTAGMSPASIHFIRDIYAEKRALNQAVISVEFFPPKTEKGNKILFEHTLPALQEVAPDFYSVTYGAGGSTRDKTLAVADRIQREHRTTTMAHLTCISTSLEDIQRYLLEARNMGIRNILALRGDPPQDARELAQVERVFEYSYQLVAFIKQAGGFSIGTAGFPESHIACKEGKYVDWQHLKGKIDHGADFVLTQLFFNNDDYFTFRDHLVETLGVTVPITPGVLPILNTEQIKRFTRICGATLPAGLLAKLETFGDDADAVSDFGIEFATRQCEALLAGGAPGLHLYSLNKARAATQIIKNLSLRGQS